jgi:hypothetical protein
MAAQDEASRSEELGESRLLEDPGITGGSLPRSSSSEALLREFVRIRSHNQLWFAGFLSCMVVFVPAIVTMALRKSSSPTQSLPSRPTPLVIQEQALAVPAGPADVFMEAWSSQKWIQCPRNAHAVPTVDAAETKKRAKAQGIDTLPVADGISDLSVPVSVVFTRDTPLSGFACQTSFCLDPGSFSMSSAAPVTPGNTAHTALQEGVQPEVTWPCEEDALYTMIMFDAFHNVTKDPGSGFLHW